MTDKQTIEQIEKELSKLHDQIRILNTPAIENSGIRILDEGILGQ